MQDIFYQSYIKEYKNALELLKKRKALQENKAKHEQEKKETLLKMKKSMEEVTKVKLRQAELLQIEETIKVKTAHIEKTNKEINEHRKRCEDKQTRVLHWDKVLKLFKKEFTDEFKSTEKK